MCKPVWPVGMEREQNFDVGFRAVVEVPAGASVTLRIAASSNYRVFVNGVFRCNGPSRAASGFYRVSAWLLDLLLRPGRNVIAIEVVGYNIDSSYVPNGPSFLQAEIMQGDQALAATGSADRGFEAFPLGQRIRRIERYNRQRTFLEGYRLTPGYDRWRVEPGASREPAKLAVCESKRLIPARTPQPTFACSRPTWQVAHGRFRTGINPEHPRRVAPPEERGKYEVLPTLEMQTVAPSSRETIDQPIDGPLRIELPADGYHILDFGRNIAGLIGATVTCTQPARFYFTFDEILSEGGVNCVRTRSDIVRFELAPGRYELEAFEPYGLRYLRLVALDAGCVVENVYLRRIEHPGAWEAQFLCDDPGLNRIFEAGRATFAPNAVDLLMDCPSRERAGWLCDSFFIARAESVLTGRCDVEHAFLENFALPESFPNLPRGMLPMCYPADFNPQRCLEGMFIPNWAMWFVLELAEYLGRGGDRTLVDALRPKVMALLKYFDAFRNERGLLEKLDAWVFVEWSKANEFVQDVSFPTNMLYAACLDAAGQLYGLADRRSEAAALRETIRALAFDGTWFVDNAERQGGKLVVTRNRTETCQYYAFFFDVATLATHGELWRMLRDDFGPQRRATGKHPEIHHANMFIGNYLRLELLSRHGEQRRLLEATRGYLLHMAERTGTLWEMANPEEGSCSHGFASHVCYSLYRDALGITAIDRVRRRVTVRLADTGLAWCSGRIPTPDGFIELHRWMHDGIPHWRIETPAGYSVTVEPAGMPGLVRVPS